MATVNATFATVLGPADLIVVDRLENYILGADPDWYAYHSTDIDLRIRDQSEYLFRDYPDWAETDLLRRSGDPIIFIEKDRLLVNGVATGTQLVMHELGHNATAVYGDPRGRWDFTTDFTVVPTRGQLFGPSHNQTHDQFHPGLSVRAKTTDDWYEWSADYIADWGYDNNVDPWQDALMKCFINNTTAATCEAEFRSQYGIEGI